MARTIKRWGLRAVLIALTPVIFLLMLRAYYALTPAALAPETLAIMAQADRLPIDTENGLRQYGLLAPEGEDPVAYGRCMLQVVREDRSTKSELDDATRLGRRRACANGKSPLATPPEVPKIHLTTSTEEWQQLEQMRIDPTLQERFETAMDGGPRYLGRDFLDPFTEKFGTLQYLHRAETARVGRQWIEGQHEQAARRWRQSNAAWSGFAEESLVSAMMAVAAQTKNLLSIHRALREGRTELSERNRALLLEALEPIEYMPEALERLLDPEWNFIISALDSVREMRGAFLLEWLAYDHNDALNIAALRMRQGRSDLRRSAQGSSVPPRPREFCAGWEGGLAEWLCPLLSRNPMGRLMNEETLSLYVSYGVRVADLRNLAAATRLMIQMHGRPTDPDSMRRMIKDAPESMRDVFTKKPFKIDPVKRVLIVQLREKSTFLGEPGPYELSLWPQHMAPKPIETAPKISL